MPITILLEQWLSHLCGFFAHLKVIQLRQQLLIFAVELAKARSMDKEDNQSMLQLSEAGFLLALCILQC